MCLRNIIDIIKDKSTKKVRGADIVKRWMRDIPLTMDEVKALMNRKERQTKWIWLGVGISVVCSLIAIALWICHRRDKYMDHYFEYFDDEDFEDEDFDYDEDSDDDQEVEYVEIVDEEEVKLESQKAEEAKQDQEESND